VFVERSEDLGAGDVRGVATGALKPLRHRNARRESRGFAAEQLGNADVGLGGAPDERGAKSRIDDRSVSSRTGARRPDPASSPELATPMNAPTCRGLSSQRATVGPVAQFAIISPAEPWRLFVNALLNPLAGTRANAGSALSNPQWSSDT